MVNTIEKINRIKAKVHNAIGVYGTLEALKYESEIYHSSHGGVDVKKLYKKVLRWQKEIVKLTRHINTETTSPHANSSNSLPNCCKNCRRCDINQSHTNQSVQNELIFTQRRSDTIACSRKFKFFTVSRTNLVTYTLCQQCARHLEVKEVNPDYNSYEYTWAGAVWYLLTDVKIIRLYSADFLWKLIPIQWRPWWLPSLKREISVFYDNITLHHPQSIFQDRSNDLFEWEDCMKRNELPEISKCCNKLLMPTVLCPWGCSTYIHKHGTIPFFIILQKYMPKVELATTTNDEFEPIKTARDDFVRDSLCGYDVWLLNPEWKILPTIIIHKGSGPMCLTCPDHKLGSKKYMIHTCRQPVHNIPALRPDQLAPCVLRPRTVKPVKKSMFSTTYQMHEQKGSFNGIDTCSVTFFGRFDFQSTLSSMNDARTISQRPDINAHLDHLVEENIISRDVADGRRQDARFVTRLTNFEPFYSASTYVPLETALSMLKENAESRTSKFWSIASNEYNHFKVSWPQYIYPCQTLSPYGTLPHLSPSFRITNRTTQNAYMFSRTWCLCTMCLSVEPLWSIISSMEVYDTSSWHGWILLFLMKKSLAFISRRQHSMDPFKMCQASSVAKLIVKLAPLIMNADQPVLFLDIFNDFGSIICFDANEIQDSRYLMNLVTTGTRTTNHEIIIIENFYSTLDISMDQLRLENGIVYELRHVSYVAVSADNSWKGFVYMRFGGRNHRKWWYSSNVSKVYVQVDECLPLSYGPAYNLVYVHEKNHNITQASSQIMSHIGGQHYVQCLYHKLPMIISTFRKGKCFCSKQEYYRCADFNCSIKCCKKCLESAVSSNTRFVHKYGMTSDANESLQTHDSIQISEEEPMSHQESGDNRQEETQGHTIDPDPEELYNDDFSIDDEDDSTYSNDEDSTNDVDDPNAYVPLQRDDYEDYVTSAEAPDFNIITDTYEEQADGAPPQMPATDSGVYPFEITETTETTGALQDLIVTGNVLLNQCGTLLTRNSHQIKGSSRGKLLLQRICATTIGHSVPLLQPEAALLPSIFWKMVPHDGVISGAIPTPLLSDKCSFYGFQALPQHIRTRLTQPGNTTSTDPHCITLYYDMMTNASATHMDTRVALNRGLTAGSDTLGGLGVRGGKDASGSALLGSIDSNQMVKNLCASQRLHPSSFFCTFTCAQARHFGTKNIKLWIDGNEWKSMFPNYSNLSNQDQFEINTGIQQCAAGLLLRNWQETCKLFLDYLRNSPSSPFRRPGSIFARNEYQKDAGNLSHIHLLIEIKWEELSFEEKVFVDNLIRTNHLDICRSTEVEQYIKEGIFSSDEERVTIQDYGKRILRHTCSPRCLERTGPGPNDFRCRHSNNLRDNPDPKNDYFLPLPNSLPDNVKQKLVELRLIDQIEVNELNYETPFKCKDEFFHPTRHIPATNPNEDVNMSPVDSYTFSICQSMQNLQLIKGTGGCNKYVCKYVGKIDEQNYVVVKANPKDNGKLTTQSNFLHNTKITGSKINEDKARAASRDNKKPTGRKISLMEMIHVMLKYPEVYTDLKFINVSTYPLAFRSSMGISAKHSKKQEEASADGNPNSNANGNGYEGAEDAATTEPNIITTRSNAMIVAWRKHTEVESTLIKDLYRSKYPIDAITRFSIRPPELRKLFNSPGEYFRWFSFSNGPCKDDFAEEFILDDLKASAFIDGIQYLVKIRLNAIDEILNYLEKRKTESASTTNEIEIMIDVIENICNLAKSDVDEDIVSDLEYAHHIRQYIIDEDSIGLLPICVYSQIRPTGGINFILHIMLSMGRFNTEMEMTVHSSLRECLRNAKLIGPSDDPIDLKKYSNDLLLRYITEQLKYFSNSRRLIVHWIEVASTVLESVIIHNEIPMTEMPSVQLTAILASREEADMKFIKEMREKLAKAVLKEVGQQSTSGNIPSYDDITNATKGEPINWDPVASHTQNAIQSEESYREQHYAITWTTRAIDRYCSFSSCDLNTKNVGIRGFPGGGKTWCSMYCILYALSKGLNCLATAVMAKRATQLGGEHWHKFFCLPVEKNLTPHRVAETALNKLVANRTRHNAVLTLDVILADEFGQLSSEFISAIDIILRNVRNSNTIFGGVLIIGTLDHTQIQPWEGRPFLTSPQLIPTFDMVNLEHSIRTSNSTSQRIQTIARMNYRTFKNEPNLVNEFISLASNTFTFVDSWESSHIVPSTFRVYSKRVPAVDAAKEFIANVKRKFANDQSALVVRNSIDTQKARYTTSAWRNATQDTSNRLEEKIKSPGKLLFFRGAVYECSYNHKDGLFNQSQIALLYDLPSQSSVDLWKPVRVLIAPPGLKEVDFDMSLPKAHYLSNGFREVDIDPCPERPVSIHHMLQGQRKQYGLKHRVTGTIHSAMGDTYESMATMISTTDKNFRIWDKGQLIVIISRTREPSKTIFVGNKRNTLEALKSLLLKRTQWTDFMEHILDVITVNSSTERTARRLVTVTPEEYPFQVSNIDLPQCQTGFVYMLVSLRRRQYTYIGTTNCVRTRIVEHNSGYGSRSTEDFRLRPFAMTAYICGFGGNRDLMYSLEAKWKKRRDELINSGNDDHRDWAMCGEDVIRAETNDVFGVGNPTLKLVLLFRSL